MIPAGQLPPEVDAQVREIAEELGEISCQYSQNCCGMYGFEPLANCADLGAEPFAFRGFLFAGENPDDYDFVIDERFVEPCLSEARRNSTDCNFSWEGLFPLWFDLCGLTLSITKQGEQPADCNTRDEECSYAVGPGHKCVNQRCVPTVEVASGDSCVFDADANSFPVCGPNDRCDGQLCKPLGQPGGECVGYLSAASCVEGYYCLDDTCQPQKDAGEPCEADGECLEVCVCSADEGCVKELCFHFPEIGDPCSTDDDCGDITLKCVAGRCDPRVLGICEPP